MTIDLFKSDKGDDYYLELRNSKESWVKQAREQFNLIYNQHRQYLDQGFPAKFPYECLSCLWELKLVIYLSTSKHGKLEIINKGKVPMPDLKWSTKEASYYFEAICVTPGSKDKYPYLNSELDKLTAREGSTGHREYRERITSAFREKAVCKYDPTQCDSITCNHTSILGYKDAIGNSGLIIAISTAKIDFMNQANNFRVDLSCFFPISPYMTMDILDKQIMDTYHNFQSSFDKANNPESPIGLEIFSNERYAHVSAVILSHRREVLFPKLSEQKYYIYGPNDNDFMIILNPFAKIPLDPHVLHAIRTCITTHTSGEFTTESIIS
jgi:hypothetical protein